MNLGKGKAGGAFGAGLEMRKGLSFEANARGFWEFECYDKDGNLKWKESIENLVVNEGLDYLLSAGLDNGTQETAWYVGLIDNASFTSIQAGDTAAKISETANPPTTNSWQEAGDYSELVRQTWVGGTVSSQSVDNSASKASFSINATVTLNGAFLVSSAIKGSALGTLYAAGSFSSTRAAVDGDTINVTATFTMADDGV